MLALALTVVAVGLLALHQTAAVPVGSAVRTWLVLAALAALAHLTLWWAARPADLLLLPIVVLLTGLGLVMIMRLDAEAASTARVLGTAGHRADAPLQLVWTALGVACFVGVVIGVRDPSRTARYTFTAAAVGLVLLVMPGLPVLGTTINGARLWLRIGPFTIQPAEFAKIILVVFFSSYLERKRDVLTLVGRRIGPLDLPRARDLAPLLTVWVASLGVLTLEHDLGLSVLFFGSFVALLFLATNRVGWLAFGGLLAGVGLFLSYLFVHNVHNRIQTWLHPMQDALGRGYQPLQAKFALGSGGISGSGLGQGQPGLVPFAKTDFMVSSLGEELGLIGLMAVVLLFALLVERGLKTAVLTRDAYSKLLAAGLSVVLALQVFFIVGGVTGLIPLTGVTLPWMSYGGSSVLSNWVLLGLLARLSAAARAPLPQPTDPSVARQALAEAATQVVVRPRRDR